MTNIRSRAGVATQINTFTVAEANRRALLELGTEAVHVCQEVPGWLSASLHRSLDGTRVITYAQSDGLDSARHVIENLLAAGYLQRNASLATAHPGLNDVAFTLER